LAKRSKKERGKEARNTRRKEGRKEGKKPAAGRVTVKVRKDVAARKEKGWFLICIAWQEDCLEGENGVGCLKR
jgi:hypothetical protein